MQETSNVVYVSSQEKSRTRLHTSARTSVKTLIANLWPNLFFTIAQFLGQVTKRKLYISSSVWVLCMPNIG